VIGLVVAVGASACAAAAGPQPAGANPSPLSVEVCSVKAETQVDEALGESTIKVTTPTWVDDLYTCDYQFPQGTIILSVKELSSAAETTAYFNQLGVNLGNKQTLFGLGQGGFLTDNGSVVVRKDWKVLLVDSTALKAPIATNHSLSGTPAETVASVIMACWAGD